MRDLIKILQRREMLQERRKSSIEQGAMISIILSKPTRTPSINAQIEPHHDYVYGVKLSFVPAPGNLKNSPCNAIVIVIIS